MSKPAPAATPPAAADGEGAGPDPDDLGQEAEDPLAGDLVLHSADRASPFTPTAAHRKGEGDGNPQCSFVSSSHTWCSQRVLISLAGGWAGYFYLFCRLGVCWSEKR